MMSALEAPKVTASLVGSVPKYAPFIVTTSSIDPEILSMDLISGFWANENWNAFIANVKRIVKRKIFI
jgi:hypothetical protein